MVRSQTNSWISRYLHFCDPFTKNVDKHIRMKFPLPLYYSRAWKGSTRHVVSFRLGGEALSRAEPPAGPLKFDLSFGDVTFSKISPILGQMSEPILQYNFFKNA